MLGRSRESDELLEINLSEGIQDEYIKIVAKHQAWHAGMYLTANINPGTYGLLWKVGLGCGPRRAGSSARWRSTACVWEALSGQALVSKGTGKLMRFGHGWD